MMHKGQDLETAGTTGESRVGRIARVWAREPGGLSQSFRNPGGARRPQLTSAVCPELVLFCVLWFYIRGIGYVTDVPFYQAEDWKI